MLQNHTCPSSTSSFRFSHLLHPFLFTVSVGPVWNVRNPRIWTQQLQSLFNLLEKILAHISITIVPVHTSYTARRCFLTRIIVLRYSLTDKHQPQHFQYVHNQYLRGICFFILVPHSLCARLLGLFFLSWRHLWLYACRGIRKPSSLNYQIDPEHKRRGKISCFSSGFCNRSLRPWCMTVQNAFSSPLSRF